MMLSIAIFKVLVAVLISAAALIMERSFDRFRWPRRWLWMAAIVLTCAVPALTILRDCTLTSDQPGRPIPQGSIENPGAGVVGHLRADYQQALVHLPELDGILNSASRAISILGFTALAIAWLAQRALLKGRPADVDGTAVLVSPRAGPAVIGFLKPRILVPEWFLELPKRVRELALAHERSHIAARDPWFLLALLLFIAAAADAATIAFLIWQFRRFRFAVEVDCDARIERDRGVQEYAQALLTVAERSNGVLLGATALVERAPDLERRIGVMLMRADGRPSRTAKVAALMALCLIVAAGLLDAPLKPYPRLVQWVHSHKEIAIAPDTLHRYTGVYEAGGAAVRFAAQGNRLVAVGVREFGPIVAGDAFAPVATGDFILVTAPRRTIRLTFANDAQGRPARLLQNVRGDLAAFRRVPAGELPRDEEQANMADRHGIQ